MGEWGGSERITGKSAFYARTTVVAMSIKLSFLQPAE